MSFVLGSVELTRSEGGMVGKLKVSLRGDGTDSKNESSMFGSSRYDIISCSAYTVARIGSIGGRLDGNGVGAGYPAASGG